jgi:molybdopterin molybdotransferase
MSRRELLDLDLALELTLDAARQIREARPFATRKRSLWEARGFVLAEDVLADLDQPPFDASAMDGFACRAEDVRAVHAELRVIGEAAAGRGYPGELGPGEAVAITTGAELPRGADAIQIVECSRREGDRVVLEGPLAPRANVRKQGEACRAGEPVVRAGRVIDGLSMGVLASVGAAEVQIQPRPRVTVVASGTELVDLTVVPGPGQIRDSNRSTLLALVEAAHGLAVDGGRVADDLEALRGVVRNGLDDDVLVISGGVSAGTYDLVTAALEAEGVEVLLHHVRIKPGKPVLVGRKGLTMVFGLPGNPVSTWVTAQLLLMPALRVLGHRPEPGPWMLECKLAGELEATGSRTTFHPGVLQSGPGGYKVSPLRWRGSADQVAYAAASCMIRCDPRTGPLEPGARVRVVLRDPPTE